MRSLDIVSFVVPATPIRRSARFRPGRLSNDVAGGDVRPGTGGQVLPHAPMGACGKREATERLPGGEGLLPLGARTGVAVPLVWRWVRDPAAEVSQ